MTEKPIAAGKSSYDMIDASIFWPALAIKKNMTLMDLGCGVGNYAIQAARYVGPGGLVYAIDAWAEGIKKLEERAEKSGIDNIRPIVADISRKIPVTQGCVDLCLLATVVHDLIQDNTFQGTMSGVQKVMSPKGRLAVVEFKKEDPVPGPPIHIRLSPEELEGVLHPYGFIKTGLNDVGPAHYLAHFERTRS
jgi:ubiquinone/menaquinone biosynthesis C-methylase UbiE